MLAPSSANVRQRTWRAERAKRKNIWFSEQVIHTVITVFQRVDKSREIHPKDCNDTHAVNLAPTGSISNPQPQNSRFLNAIRCVVCLTQRQLAKQWLPESVRRLVLNYCSQGTNKTMRQNFDKHSYTFWLIHVLSVNQLQGRVFYSYNKTNEMHWFLKFIFGMQLYMFRTGFLSIIRSLVLYTQQ